MAPSELPETFQVEPFCVRLQKEESGTCSSCKGVVAGLTTLTNGVLLMEVILLCGRRIELAVLRGDRGPLARRSRKGSALPAHSSACSMHYGFQKVPAKEENKRAAAAHIFKGQKYRLRVAKVSGQGQLQGRLIRKFHTAFLFKPDFDSSGPHP